jgi:hypothetical protein
MVGEQRTVIAMQVPTSFMAAPLGSTLPLATDAKKGRTGLGKMPRAMPSLILIAILFPSVAFADLELHVDQAAAPGGDGLSWATAYRHLQDALHHASERPAAVEIRVAQGVYRPDEDEGGLVVPGDRAASFHLKSGVSVLGGFAGAGGNDPSERDVDTFSTVLSGDLNEDDVLYFVNVDDNAYHVVTARGTDATAVLDGVTVSGGNTFGLNGGELQEYLENGAGVFCWDGSPTLRNCTFRLCRAVRGGVVYANGETWYDGELQYVAIAPTLIDCLFTENYSVFYGGAVALNVSGVTMKRCRFIWNETTGALGGCALSLRHAAIDGREAVIHQCEFSGNFATFPSSGAGGALRIVYVPTQIASTTFVDNTAEGDGGAIHISPLNWSIDLASCTVAGNRSINGNGGGLRVTGFNVSIHGSVLWGNEQGGQTPPDECGQLCGPSETTIQSSCVEGWSGQYTGDHVISTDPMFVDPDGPDGDPATWDDNDYRLGAGSPCIDAGDNALVPQDLTDLDGDGVTAEPIPFDLDGHDRFVDDPRVPDTGFGDPPVVDMGAYESQVSCQGDVNGDLAVGVEDLVEVVLQWGPCAGCTADVTGDDAVDVADLVEVILNWGPCPIQG